MADESSEKREREADEATEEAKPETEAGGAPAEASPEDDMSPEAIAKRVEALGGDDELEKIARDEELKLAERRAKTKGGKKKGGLEAAASKRLAKIGGKAPPRRVAVAADVDPLLARSGAFGTWMRKNQKAVGVLSALAVVAAIGAGAYAWWTNRVESMASADITAAVQDEQGRIGDPDKEDDDNGPKDPRPVFKTTAERRDAALAKYREVESKFKGTGAAYLSRLEEASLLLDKGDLDGAQAAFTDASTSPLAAADAEVKGRALEGLGLVYEARAVAKPEEKDKWLDQAAQQFRALENTDVKGFKELGMYHQARVAEAKGDKDKAVQLLKSLHERLSAPGESHPFPYLENVADDRLRALDPLAIPAKSKGPPPGMGASIGGGANGMTEEQKQKLIEQLLKNAQQGGGGGNVPIPAPAPK
jgi:hypothetical protein